MGLGRAEHLGKRVWPSRAAHLIEARSSARDSYCPPDHTTWSVSSTRPHVQLPSSADNTKNQLRTLMSHHLWKPNSVHVRLSGACRSKPYQWGAVDKRIPESSHWRAWSCRSALALGELVNYVHWLWTLENEVSKDHVSSARTGCATWLPFSSRAVSQPGISRSFVLDDEYVWLASTHADIGQHQENFSRCSDSCQHLLGVFSKCFIFALKSCF